MKGKDRSLAFSGIVYFRFFFGVVRLLQPLQSLVLLSLGRDREDWAGVYFSGMPHVGPSKSDKKKRGDRKGSRNTFVV